MSAEWVPVPAVGTSVGGAVPEMTAQAYPGVCARPVRRSFDVASCPAGPLPVMGPIPSAAAGGSPFNAATNSGPIPTPDYSSGMISNLEYCNSTVQLQQHGSLNHMAVPTTTAERVLDDQIHTVLMDILDLGSQLAEAADAAGVGTVMHDPRTVGRCSLDQPNPYYPDNTAVLAAAELRALALQQQQQQAMQQAAIGAAAVRGAGSPRSSIDLLCLQQQVRLANNAAAGAPDVAGLGPLGPAAAGIGAPCQDISYSRHSFELDVIDEHPADLTAYFARHQQQKLKHQQFVTVASGHGSPVHSSSPLATAVLGANCSGLGGGLCNQLMSAGFCNQASAESVAYASNLSPEAQAKLQELMAAQQLQLEIQNELLAMLSVY